MPITIPDNVKDYFWKLAMMFAFVALTTILTRYAGPNAPALPAPTIQVQPVVVNDKDGTMRILTIETIKP